MAGHQKDKKSGLEFKWIRDARGKRVRIPVGSDETALQKVGPWTLTDKRSSEAIDLYMRGFTMKQIAASLNVDVRAVYRWMQTHGGFAHKMREARKLRGIFFEDKAVEAADEADEDNVQSQRLKVDTAKWAAEVNDRETYGKHTKLTGEVHHAVLMVDTGIRRDDSTDAIPVESTSGGDAE